MMPVISANTKHAASIQEKALVRLCLLERLAESVAKENRIPNKRIDPYIRAN